MKVLLIHAPRLVVSDGRLDVAFINIPAVGLPAIAAHLHRRGHEATIVHMGVELLLDSSFRLEKLIRNGGYGLVGLSLHWHHQLHESISLTKYLKHHCPDVPIVVGGLTASAYSRELMSRVPEIDFVIRGEAEVPLEQLARHIDEGLPFDGIGNLTFRRAGDTVENPIGFVADEEFFRELPFADTRFFRNSQFVRQPVYFDPAARPISEYFESDSYYLTTGRGCTMNCCYCGGSASAHRTLAGRRGVTFRPLQDVVADLRRLVEAGYRRVYFCFDPPPKAHDYYLELFRLLEPEKLDLGFEFDAYVPHGREFYRAMTRAFAPERCLVSFSPDTADEASRRKHKDTAIRTQRWRKTSSASRNSGLRVRCTSASSLVRAWNRFATRRSGRPGWSENTAS